VKDDAMAKKSKLKAKKKGAPTTKQKAIRDIRACRHLEDSQII